MVCHVGRAMRTIKIGGAKAESYCLVSEHIIAESLEHISFFSSTLSSKHQKSKQMVLPLVGGSLGRGYFSASETKTHRKRLVDKFSLLQTLIADKKEIDLPGLSHFTYNGRVNADENLLSEEGSCVRNVEWRGHQ